MEANGGGGGGGGQEGADVMPSVKHYEREWLFMCLSTVFKKDKPKKSDYLFLNLISGKTLFSVFQLRMTRLRTRLVRPRNQRLHVRNIKCFKKAKSSLTIHKLMIVQQLPCSSRFDTQTSIAVYIFLGISSNLFSTGATLVSNLEPVWGIYATKTKKAGISMITENPGTHKHGQMQPKD